MAFDPSFVENVPYISRIFSKPTCIKSEIPTMVPLNPSSTPPLDPSHETNFLYQNNCHHSQQHPLNEGNHHSSFAMEGPSSINPFFMIPTPSLGNSYIAGDTIGSMTDFPSACYPMGFSPNDNKMETILGYQHNGNNYLDFVSENPLQYSSIFKSQVGPSSSPLLVDDTHASMHLKPNVQDELSRVVGIGKNLQDTDLRFDVGDPKKQKIVHSMNRVTQHIDTNIIKGQWTADEDRILIKLVDLYGLKQWAKISKLMNGRIGKQCRERWYNHLQPNIKKGSLSEEEEKILIEAHRQIGNKWVEIAKRLPGRAGNTIKNHWNATKRRLNVKRKQNNRKSGSTESLLQKYIKEVTNAKFDAYELNPSMRMMNIESKQDLNNNNYHDSSHGHYESLGGDLNSGYQAIQDNEVSWYMPVMFNSGEMVNGSSTMDYNVEMQMV